MIEKQGIVSILRSDCEQTKTASLRGTLSADMSSKKWLAQNGFSPMKKIASFEQLAISAVDSSSSLEEEEEYEGKIELNSLGQFEVRRSIQLKKKKELENPIRLGVWSSILSQKADEDPSKLPPPYVHPLVKRASSLSEKSLKVCTESLGSETGSDGFSSYPPSETGEANVDKEEVQQQEEEKESHSFDGEKFEVVKYNYSTSMKSPPRSFPPPLPSLVRSDGPSLHMHATRQNGRLVLDAVSVPLTNYFQVQRQDGRLLLSLGNSPSEDEPNHEAIVDQEDDKLENFEDVFDNFGEEEDVGNGVKKDEQEEQEAEEEMDDEIEKESGGHEMDQAPNNPISGVINVHRSALMMRSLMGLDNRNSAWPHKFNKAVKSVEEEATPLPHSLPPAPRVARQTPLAAAAASFNAYNYFWRPKPTAASVINPISQQCSPLKNNCKFRRNKADH